MSVPRPKPTDNLEDLHRRSVDQHRSNSGEAFAIATRRRMRLIARLRKQRVVTVVDLLNRLSHLSPKLKSFGIELISLLNIRQGISALLEILLDPASDRGVRLSCANALYLLKAGRNATRMFAQIGHRELASSKPDPYWLEAVILGLGSPNDPAAVELLVRFLERVDLPGWVRGDAADKLGCVGLIRDRRTKLYRRCRDATLRGLDDAAIDVQFWSMYLISQLCNSQVSWHSPAPRDFESALPRLRKIAAHDHRLAPGYWWPMSAEAEDAIGHITGKPRDSDAAERWLGNPKRGHWNRD